MKTPRSRDTGTLCTAVAQARIGGARDTPVTERARRMLGLYVETAEAQGMPKDDLVRSLRSGVPALRIAGADLEQIAAQSGGPLDSAACAAGCAFCCILPGSDGGVITEAEARQVHAALLPLAGAPDGRDWHPRACAALDPVSRTCRIYDARPLICRTYLSDDAAACERIAQGIPATGAGVLGSQGLMLAVQSLARAALSGVSKVATYSLARTAASAAEGADAATALRAARHPPRVLDDERRRFGG